MFSWFKNIFKKEEKIEIEKEKQVVTIKINDEEYTTDDEKEIGELLKIFSDHFPKK